MQNAYASPGGYVDLAGFDIAGAAGTIGQIAKVLETARAAGVQIVYLQNGWDPDYVEAGGPGSPNWHKSNALKTMRARPELQGKLLAKGGWDYDLVDALTPQARRHRPAPRPATAPSSTRSSTARCARAASATSSSSASPPTSASNRLCATASTSNISG